MEVRKRYYQYLYAFAIGLTYGLAMRLILLAPGALHHEPFYPTDLWVMTSGFLVGVPLVCGWLVISRSTFDEGFHWARWIFAPWLVILASDAGLIAGAIEGAICIIMAIPITLVFSSIGGIAAGLTTRSRFLHRRSTTICIALLPLLISSVEMQVTPPHEIRTVNTSIVIHAPASVVWRNIERVPAINPSELRPTWTHNIGFPLPVEATLDHEGIGGIRHASFQGGLVFIETINRWQPQHQIAFGIAVDTADIPATTLDDHVTIGGRYFDVLNGEYRLEPLPNGNILLRLSSQERLSTDFNAYAALWTDGVMRDLQQSILQVVKHRCEMEAAMEPLDH